MRWLSLFLIICLWSCVDNKFISYNDVINQEFFIPDSILKFEEGVFSFYSNDGKMQTNSIVCWVDTTHCSACVINNVAYQKKEFLSFIESNNNIPMSIIISTTETGIDQLIDKLKFKPIPFDIYIDYNNEIGRHNNYLPIGNEYFHFFYVDDSAKIRCYGMPFDNEQLESEYKRIINKGKKH